MANHIKPTREELEANAQAALDALETMPEEKTPEEPPKPEEKLEDTKTPEENKDDLKLEDQKPPEEKPEDTKTPEEESELKKKLSASARENQRILAKNKILNQAIDEVDQIPEPTVEELAVEYPEWEDMTATEQRLAKESFMTSQWKKKISQAREQGRKVEKWHEQVDEFVQDPKNLNAYPDLEGKIEDFKVFASEDANSGTPFKILINAFLHEHQVQKPNNKGQMFEQGSGGSKEVLKPPDDTLTTEQGFELLKKDPRKWKELKRAGKIKDPE